MILFVYANILHRVKLCFANKSYMHTPLISLLRVSKERCEEYTVLALLFPSDSKLIYNQFGVFIEFVQGIN